MPRASRYLPAGLLVAIVVWAPVVTTAQQNGPWQTYGTENGEWRSYGGNIASQKYSPLDQIDAGNFSGLEIAWRWQSVDAMVSRTMPDGSEWWAPLDAIVESLVADTPNLYRAGHLPRPGGMAATPLMVGGAVYLNTALSQGVAIDATTGETRWVFNPKSYEEGTTPMSGTFKQRGVAYWTDGEGDERIFWGTGSGYLVCVDAQTGQPCADFGPDGSGMVDAMVGMPRAVREDRDYLNALLYGIHSPPIVVRDRVIHGSQVADRRITKEAVPGWVRAWDVRTGEHTWDFHTVPNSPDEFGADTWLNDSWRYSGNANVWSFLSGDNELGHVYLPTGTATNDYYGVDRPGDNLFSESIIAVDPETGMLYVPSRNNAVVITLYAPDPALGATVAYTHGAPEADRLAGRGLGPSRRGALMPQGLPLLKPPYSRMTAIDMNTGDHAWMVPLGDGDRYRNHPLLRDLNLPPLGGDGWGGPVLTKTLLISALSAGGRDGGPRLVARSKQTGEELGSVDLPTGALGTPMTYMVDGRQYIALTIGGRPPELIAFVLPD